MSKEQAVASDRWIRSAGVLEAVQGDARILFHTESGNYCDLNTVGAGIWDLLAEPQSLDDLVARLTERYAVDARTCESQTRSFLNTLVESSFVSAAAPA